MSPLVGCDPSAPEPSRERSRAEGCRSLRHSARTMARPDGPAACADRWDRDRGRQPQRTSPAHPAVATRARRRGHGASRAERWSTRTPASADGRTERAGQKPGQLLNRLRKTAEKSADDRGAVTDNDIPASGQRFPLNVERVENASASPARISFFRSPVEKKVSGRKGCRAVLPFSSQPSTTVRGLFLQSF
jgi:hypothetical protein